MFSGLTVLKEALSETMGFLETLPKQTTAAVYASTKEKHLMDTAFQANILLFAARGEIEKLNKSHALNDAQKKDLADVCDRINKTIQLAHAGVSDGVFEKINKVLVEVVSDMERISNGLGWQGNPIKFVSVEINNLAGRVAMH